MNVVDCFSGVGGLSLGFQLAGYTVLGSVEANEYASKAHELNFPNSVHVTEDIRTVSNDRLRELFGDKVDVLVGGASMSVIFECESYG